MPEATTSGAVELELGNQKIMVAPDLAKAFESEREIRSKEFEDYKVQQEATLRQFRESIVIPDPTDTQTISPVEDVGGGFWDDPEKHLEKFKEDLRSENKKEREQAQQVTNSKKIEDDFWDEFYKHKDNKSLDRATDDLVVQGILKRDGVELGSLGSKEKIIKELGNRTQKYIVETIAKTKMKSQKKEEVVLEGAGNNIFELDPEGEPPKTEGTLSDIIKARRANRRDKQRQNRTGTK